MARRKPPERNIGCRPWHRLPEGERAAAVIAKIDQLARDQAYRKVLAKARLGAYLGRRVTNLSADIYYQRDEVIQQSYAMAICDTAQANIAAKQRPKAQVLTYGADYYLQLEAEKVSKVLEGCLWAPQPGYANTWEIGEQVFHDATWSEAGVIYVYGDASKSIPTHERVFAHDIYVDPEDAKTGAPLVLNHAHLCSKDILIDAFPEHAAAIEQSGVATMHSTDRTLGDSGDMCTVYKSWRRGKRVVFAVNGGGRGGTALRDDEWEHDRFPFAFVRWQRNAYGIWGSPMVDQIRVNQDHANEILEAIVRNTKDNADGYIDIERGSHDAAQLEDKTGTKVLEREPGTAPMNINRPMPYNPMTFDTFLSLKGACYELAGYSEMSTQGRKDQSITSGVAIRTVNDMQDERHLVRARAYEQLYIEIGKLDLIAIQDILAGDGKVSTKSVQNGTIESIDWDEIDMQQNQFEVTIQASSTTEDTIAAQRQTIEDLTRMGYLSPAVSEQVLTAPNPDVESLTKRESAQRRLMDKIVARFSRYNPEKQERGEVFEAPDPLLNLVDCVRQMTDGYMVAREREAPEEVLQLFRDYITQAGEMLKSQQEKQMAAQQAQAGPPQAPQGMMPPQAPGRPALQVV